jgi:hypothetical protein
MEVKNHLGQGRNGYMTIMGCENDRIEARHHGVC